jgi:hypothetical protein
MTMKDATGFSIERERNNFSWLLTENETAIAPVTIALAKRREGESSTTTKSALRVLCGRVLWGIEIFAALRRT